jgi:hypothetical protein
MLSTGIRMLSTGIAEFQNRDGGWDDPSLQIRRPPIRPIGSIQSRAARNQFVSDEFVDLVISGTSTHLATSRSVCEAAGEEWMLEGQ